MGGLAYMINVRIQWKPGYSDRFGYPQGCHLKRISLYVLKHYVANQYDNTHSSISHSCSHDAIFTIFRTISSGRELKDVTAEEEAIAAMARFSFGCLGYLSLILFTFWRVRCSTCPVSVCYGQSDSRFEEWNIVLKSQLHADPNINDTWYF